jgi:hypothetical protein
MVALSTIVPQLELNQVIQEFEFMEKTIGVQEEANEVDPIEVIKTWIISIFKDPKTLTMEAMFSTKVTSPSQKVHWVLRHVGELLLN